ncbi:hypothetical protein AMTR_s00056p00055320 [Amborella trichopoda]|uniref:Uncharacterized protein n=1 Tax=Amborella trichopoda TaxID=13333 RepID=U5CYR3_AMBTC|nr:hypothetical protein AMTR_s00056p00055320 [Amborella trichopoda]
MHPSKLEQVKREGGLAIRSSKTMNGYKTIKWWRRSATTMNKLWRKRPLPISVEWMHWGSFIGV